MREASSKKGLREAIKSFHPLYKLIGNKMRSGDTDLSLRRSPEDL